MKNLLKFIDKEKLQNTGQPLVIRVDKLIAKIESMRPREKKKLERAYEAGAASIKCLDKDGNFGQRVIKQNFTSYWNGLKNK